MNFFPHAKSATFAKDFSDQKNNPFRPLRPLREPSPTPHAKSATFAKDFSDQKNNPSRPLRPLRDPSPTPHAKSAKVTTNIYLTKNNPFRPLRPLREPSAFSLTEVVIAMGVAAVAFTSIIALFPLGLSMSKESYEATQAALIAQTIIADLSDSGSAQAGGKIIQITGSNAMNTNNYTTIPMTVARGATADRYVYLAYDQKIRTDSFNSPIMLRPTASVVSSNGPADPQWFTDGTNGPILLVKVSIKHSFLLGGPPTTNNSANPQRVDVTVESPASAPATNRTQYVFTRIIHQS
jgi:type II secretory pathway pseudopilin PulG